MILLFESRTGAIVSREIECPRVPPTFFEAWVSGLALIYGHDRLLSDLEELV